MTEINQNPELKEKVLVASNVEMLELLTELIGEGKIVRLKVQGTSMMPFLHDGLDTVELSKPTDQELIPGAIVLFRYRDGFLLHRIISRKGNVLTNRGDNIYLTEKEVVLRDQVVGIVCKIIYPGGREISTNSSYWRILSKCWLLIKPISRLPIFVFLKSLQLVNRAK